MSSSSPPIQHAATTSITASEEQTPAIKVSTSWPRDGNSLSKFELLQQYVEKQQQELFSQEEHGSTESLPALRPKSPSPTSSALRPPRGTALRRSHSSVQFAKDSPRVYRYPATEYEDENNKEKKKASLALS